MAGKLPAGQKELLRGKLPEMVKQGKMTLRAAADQMKISYRQGTRLDRGGMGLTRGSRGKPSNRGTAADIRGRAHELCRKLCRDFGPAFAAEKPAGELL
ncbi:MAG: hypothetical protein LBG27_10260 [Spirochaetaceae bacterium]|nr:hypothetical protein [Spirochaetaceae bacterium]